MIRRQKHCDSNIYDCSVYQGSDSSMSFARLHTIQDDDDDDLITEPSSISSDINFGNPIFSSDKIQYSDDDN